MRNSCYSKKSEFKRYNALHRADVGHRKRNVTDTKFAELTEGPIEEYDFIQDYMVEAIEGILEEMAIDTDKLWFNAKIFQLWMSNQNYSALERELDIPRTTISNAVKETINYIKQELNNRNIRNE
jgi:hypothetical protein